MGGVRQPGGGQMRRGGVVNVMSRCLVEQQREVRSPQYEEQHDDDQQRSRRWGWGDARGMGGGMLFWDKVEDGLGMDMGMDGDGLGWRWGWDGIGIGDGDDAKPPRRSLLLQEGFEDGVMVFCFEQ